MKKFYCRYLNGNVELTDERLSHIKQRHPDIEPFLEIMPDVLLKPSVIRQRHNILLFSIFIEKIKKDMVVVIKSETERNFILTSYLTSKIKGGEILWMKEE